MTFQYIPNSSCRNPWGGTTMATQRGGIPKGTRTGPRVLEPFLLEAPVTKRLKSDRPWRPSSSPAECLLCSDGNGHKPRLQWHRSRYCPSHGKRCPQGSDPFVTRCWSRMDPNESVSGHLAHRRVDHTTSLKRIFQACVVAGTRRNHHCGR